MPVQSTKLGPGALTIGAAGSLKEFGVAAQKVTVTPSASDGEVLETLDGSTVVDEGVETWVLEGSILQGYAVDSLLAYCNTNSGTTQPFTFKPTNSAVLKVAGKVLVRSVPIGGDVKKRNTSDFSWKATEVVITTV